jgi:hypothetical protein
LSGETDLEKIVSGLSPTLLDEEFIFCSFKNIQYGDRAELQPLAVFAETEGMTMVISRELADKHGVDYTSVFRCITLMVHSSLESVGLTAVVSAKLAQQGIPANIIAGYYHDHIFVESSNAERARAVLGS